MYTYTYVYMYVYIYIHIRIHVNIDEDLQQAAIEYLMAYIHTCIHRRGLAAGSYRVPDGQLTEKPQLHRPQCYTIHARLRRQEA